MWNSGQLTGENLFSTDSGLNWQPLTDLLDQLEPAPTSAFDAQPTEATISQPKFHNAAPSPGQKVFINKYKLCFVALFVLLLTGVGCYVIYCFNTTNLPPIVVQPVKDDLPSNVTMSGSIFIVTRGGQNLKLGLVSVSLCNSEDASKYISSFHDVLKKQVSDLKDSYEKLKPDCDAAVDAYEKVLPDYNAAYSSLNKEMDAISVSRDQPIVEFNSQRTAKDAQTLLNLDAACAKLGALIKPLYEDARTKTEALDDIRQKQHTLVFDHDHILNAFIAGFPAQVSTKTDADGKFALVAPRGHAYMLVASATRDVGDETENYFWSQLIPADSGDNQIVTLSNDNLQKELPDGATDFSGLLVPEVRDVRANDFIVATTAYQFFDENGNAAQVPLTPQ